jgi:hypothetical protein
LFISPSRMVTWPEGRHSWFPWQVVITNPSYTFTCSYASVCSVRVPTVGFVICALLKAEWLWMISWAGYWNVIACSRIWASHRLGGIGKYNENTVLVTLECL